MFGFGGEFYRCSYINNSPHGCTGFFFSGQKIFLKPSFSRASHFLWGLQVTVAQEPPGIARAGAAGQCAGRTRPAGSFVPSSPAAAVCRDGDDVRGDQ
jgi:hypothetical protein